MEEKEVNLSERGFSTLDGVAIPEDTEKLWLNNNNLSVLKSEWFPAGLTLLYLEANGIKSIAGITFPPTLLDLSFNDNLIETLAGAIFPDGLEQLWLNGNRLTSLRDASFPASIHTLDIGENETLTRLGDAVFPPRLEILYVEDSRIKDLDSVTFPDSLQSITFTDDHPRLRKDYLRFGEVRWPLSLTHLFIGNYDFDDGLELPETLEQFFMGYDYLKCRPPEHFYASPHTAIHHSLWAPSAREASSATCARRLLTLPPPIDPLPVQAWVARISYLLGGVTWQMVEDAIYKKNDDKDELMSS